MNTRQRIAVGLVLAMIWIGSGCGQVPTAALTTTGQVRGVLVADETGEAVDATVNLLAVKVNENGTTDFVSGDYEKRSILEQGTTSGEFVFDEVQPGSYVMTAEIAGQPQQINDAKGNLIVVMVEAGQAIDLGQVHVYLSLVK
jgi:hypothetical protein